MEDRINRFVERISNLKMLQLVLDSFTQLIPYTVILSVSALIGSYFIPPLYLFKSISIALHIFYLLLAYEITTRVCPTNAVLITSVGVISFWVLGTPSIQNVILFSLWMLLITHIEKMISKQVELLGKRLPSSISTILKNLTVNLLLILVITIVVTFLLMTQDSLLTFLLLLESYIYKIVSFLPFYLLVSGVILILWTYGYHGDRLVGQFVDPILILLTLINMENMIYGINNYSIINGSFHLVFAMGTGTGMTGALLIATRLWMKDPKIKSDIKQLEEGSLFNINEPVIFGLPVAFNKELSLPFIIAPLVSICFGYLMIHIGFIQPFIYPVPWITPPLLKSFIASGGDLKSVLVELGSYLLAILIYATYVMKLNKKEVRP